MNKWVCKNDKCEKPCYAEPPNTCCPINCLLKDYITPNWQKADEPATNDNQLPKLTAEVFNRPDCPAWAKYAAVDENGKAYYFTNKPKCYSEGYFRDLGWDAGHFMLIGDFDSSDWKNSLIERPVKNTLPKLTAEVFDREDCPEWAKWVAMDADGKVCYYSSRPILNSTTWLDKEGNWQIIKENHQYVYFDASDWKNSLIERPKKNTLPKLTTEVFDRPNFPKNADYAVVTPEGRVIAYTSKPYINEEYQCWGFAEGCCFTFACAGSFDTSDWRNSLIERPAKLPEWCTVDAMCWHKRCGYFKVTYIDSVSRRVDIQQVDDKPKGYLSFNTVCNDVCQAHIRNYNEEEMQGLVGKVIENDNFAHFINTFDKDLKEAVSGSDGYTASELLEFGYTINGEPCGKFEHLENGKWVE